MAAPVGPPPQGPTDLDTSKQLFRDLDKKTEVVEMLDQEEAEHRFLDVPSPRDTAIEVNGRYLHANRVSFEGGGNYILTQYPLPSTFSQFFQLAHDEECLILDLTNDNDKVDHYWPGRMTDERHMQVHEKTLIRIHFREWQDYKGAAAQKLLDLIKEVDAENPKSILVHCRAGMGRSGTFVTARELYHLHLAGEKDLHPKMEEIILSGRKQRGPLFVQSYSQIETLRGFIGLLS